MASKKMSELFFFFKMSELLNAKDTQFEHYTQ